MKFHIYFTEIKIFLCFLVFQPLFEKNTPKTVNSEASFFLVSGVRYCNRGFFKNNSRNNGRIDLIFFSENNKKSKKNRKNKNLMIGPLLRKLEKKRPILGGLPTVRVLEVARPPLWPYFSNREFLKSIFRPLIVLRQHKKKKKQFLV